MIRLRPLWVLVVLSGACALDRSGLGGDTGATATGAAGAGATTSASGVTGTGTSTGSGSGSGGSGGNGTGSGGSGGNGPGSGGSGGGVTDPWWDPAWERRVRLTFDNAASPEPHASFAVLIKLTPARFDYASSPAGQDLRFIDADGLTPLSFEIERWINGDDSFIWVRVPEIDAGSVTDHIWLYYGNAGAPSTQNPAEVWAGTHAGVYHLGDNPALGAINDSKGSHDGAANGAMNAGDQVNGVIAGAIDFDGMNDYIQLGPGNHADDFDVDPGTARTVEAWLRTATGDRPLVWQEASCAGWGLLMLPSGAIQGRLFLGTDCPADQLYLLDSPETSYDNNQWHHVALVLDRPAGTMHLHIDGVRVVTQNGVNNSTPGGGYYDRIGGDYTGTQGFDGAIDEVRISTLARSDAWIAAQYASMRDMFVTYGMTEQAP